MNCMRSVTFSNPGFKSGNSLWTPRFLAHDSQITFLLDSLHMACSTSTFRRQRQQFRQFACHRRSVAVGVESRTQDSSIVAEHSWHKSEVGLTVESGGEGSLLGRFPRVSRKTDNAVESLYSCS